MSGGWRDAPVVPGDSVPGVKARGVDQLSLVTRAWFQGAEMLTQCLWRLGPGSEGPRCLQISRATRAYARGLAGSTSCLAPLGPLPEAPWCQPDVPGESGQGPRACGVDQLSQATCTWVRSPAASASIPGQLGSGCEGPQGRPAVPCHLGPFQRSRGVDQPSQATQARDRGPVVSTCSAGRLGTLSDGPRCHQTSWASQASALGPGCQTAVPGNSHLHPVVPSAGARVQGTAGSTNSPGRLRFCSDVPRSTSCPERLGPMPNVPQGQPAVPGDLVPGRGDRVVDQASWATRACTEGPQG